MTIRSLEEVVKNELCCGCGLCEAISSREVVQMEFDSRGFLRPLIHQPDRVPWEKIKPFCPGVGLIQEENPGTTDLERLWGPVRISRQGFAVDEDLRWNGSSGGALSATLVYLLESGSAKYVSHVRLGNPDPLNANLQLSRTRQDVLACSGSLYMPTSPLTGLLDMLQNADGPFAFVGKPCDAAALRTFIKHYPQYESKVTAIISFFCAGVPSQLATMDLISKLGVQPEDIASFRYRGKGWPGQATVVDRTNNMAAMSYSESWGQILSKQLQFRCKICPDGVGEFADIVFADAWKTKDGYPDFDDNPGWSLILARTKRGEEILGQAQASGYLSTTDFSLNTLGTVQPSQKFRRQAIAPRLLALKLLRKPAPTFLGFFLVENALHAGVTRYIKGVLGMVRRVMLKGHG